MGHETELIAAFVVELIQDADCSGCNGGLPVLHKLHSDRVGDLHILGTDHAGINQTL